MPNSRFQLSDISEKISQISDTPLEKLTFTFLDTETTGLSPKFGDRICEIALVCCLGTHIVETFDTLVNPGRSISAGASAINGITDKMVADAPGFEDIFTTVRRLMDGAILVAHNAQFDLNFLSSQFRLLGQRLPECIVLDTLILARKCYHFPSNSLGRIALSLGLETSNLHRAREDTLLTQKIFSRLLSDLSAQDINNIEKILSFQGGSIPVPKDLQIILPPLLEEAMSSERELKLRYVSAYGRKTTRIVQPLEITRFKDYLYLIAHCYLRGDQRTFRLDRILKMEVLDK